MCLDATDKIPLELGLQTFSIETDNILGFVNMDWKKIYINRDTKTFKFGKEKKLVDNLSKHNIVLSKYYEPCTKKLWESFWFLLF